MIEAARIGDAARIWRGSSWRSIRPRRRGEDADETGIVVAGKRRRAGTAMCWPTVSGRYTPAEWARVAIAA